MFLSFHKNLWYNFLILIILLSAGCQQKTEELKIPITTSSEEARQSFIKGRDLQEKIKLNDAFKCFNEAIDKDKDFALAYLYRSFVNPSTKGFFEDLKKASSLSDKVSEGERLMILSANQDANSKFKDEEETLQKLIKKFPSDERANAFLGVFYSGQQMYDKAIEYLKKSTEIAPDYSASYNLLGYSYRSLENYEEAEKAFKKYIELIPSDPNPYDSYAELLMKEGKYLESIEQYRKALEKDSNFVSSIVGISNNYNYLDKYDEARKELQLLYDKARNNGDKATALFSMAVSFADEGKLDRALGEIEKLYELNKKNEDTVAMSNNLLTMYFILLESGKYNEALKKSDESLKTILISNAPNEVKENSQIQNLYNTVRVLLEKNDLKGAKEKSDEFDKRVNATNNIFLTYLSHQLNGLIALKENDFKKAENEFKMANQQNPYTLYYLGLTYKKLENEDAANKMFKAAANYNALNSLNQSYIRKKAAEMWTAKTK